MYHGAEHKCINCIEHGLELNVENDEESSKQHKRCGTSFLFFVDDRKCDILLFYYGAVTGDAALLSGWRFFLLLQVFLMKSSNWQATVTIRL